MVHFGIGIGWPGFDLIARSSWGVLTVIGHTCIPTYLPGSLAGLWKVQREREREWHDLFFRVHATPHWEHALHSLHCMRLLTRYRAWSVQLSPIMSTCDWSRALRCVVSYCCLPPATHPRIHPKLPLSLISLAVLGWGTCWAEPPSTDRLRPDDVCHSLERERDGTGVVVRRWAHGVHSSLAGGQGRCVWHGLDRTGLPSTDGDASMCTVRTREGSRGIWPGSDSLRIYGDEGGLRRREDSWSPSVSAVHCQILLSCQCDGMRHSLNWGGSGFCFIRT